MAALRSDEFRDLLRVQSISPLYRSDAMLLEGASPEWNRSFLNLVVVAEWVGLPADPRDLLARLKALEARLGRTARGRWAPREIDIDILLLDSLTSRRPSWSCPTRACWQRPFALLPLADILPEWRPPGSDRTAGALAGVGGIPIQLKSRSTPPAPLTR